MDISLFSLVMLPREDLNPGETYEFKWAVANNPCWILKDCNFEELIPDKMPVGIHHSMDRFKTITWQLKKGDKLYLFTDGYKDQFGGPFSKKFILRQLKELIIENSSIQMDKQKDIPEQKIEEWRTGFGNVSEQTDDISKVGIEI